jgi:hypothetical protein
VNREAGQRLRGGCDRSELKFCSGYEFAPSWMLGFKSWSEVGAETGSAKAEITRGYDFDIVSVAVGSREEISGNFDEKGWILVARSSF